MNTLKENYAESLAVIIKNIKQIDQNIIYINELKDISTAKNLSAITGCGPIRVAVWYKYTG